MQPDKLKGTTTMPTATTAAPLITAPIGPTQWRLVSIGQQSASCDHCGRTLKNTYDVINPAGKRMTLGRGCVKKVTGWNLAQAEAARILRLEVRHAERRARWAAYRAENPEDAARIEADITAWTAWYTGRPAPAETGAWNGAASGAGPAAELRDWIADGRPEWLVSNYFARRARGEFGSWAR